MNPPTLRLQSIDIVRGLAVVLMALDHAREFLAPSDFSATDAHYASPLLFVTRWITHFCAPTFVFLAGVSVRLAVEGQQRNLSSERKFLARRGLILLLLEFTLVALGWDFQFREVNLQVIWALGCSMLLLASVLKLRPALVGAIGVAAILLSAAMLETMSERRLGEWLPKILSSTGPLANSNVINVRVTYPILPWSGLMFVGYAAGKWVSDSLRNDLRRILKTGVLLIIASIAARLVELQPNDSLGKWPALSAAYMNFVDFQKNPPSLPFLLCMLGCCLMTLGYAARISKPIGDCLAVFGRAALFFYVLHLFILQALRWVKVAWVHLHLPGYHALPPDLIVKGGSVSGIYWAYAATLFVLATLFVPCLRFSSIKKARRTSMLAYL